MLDNLIRILLGLVLVLLIGLYPIISNSNYVLKNQVHSLKQDMHSDTELILKELKEIRKEING